MKYIKYTYVDASNQNALYQKKPAPEAHSPRRCRSRDTFQSGVPTLGMQMRLPTTKWMAKSSRNYSSEFFCAVKTN